MFYVPLTLTFNLAVFFVIRHEGKAVKVFFYSFNIRTSEISKQVIIFLKNIHALTPCMYCKLRGRSVRLLGESFGSVGICAFWICLAQVPASSLLMIPFVVFFCQRVEGFDNG